MSTRPSADEVWLAVAHEVAQSGTCARRKVGAVFVDIYGRQMSTGFNGVASKEEHCTDHPCAAANAPSGTALNECLAIHAEENALEQCRDTKQIETVYCTAAPCFDRCLRKLLNTSAKRIVFATDYPGSEKSKEAWLRQGREWIHLQIDHLIWQPLSEKLNGLYYARPDVRSQASCIVYLDSGTITEVLESYNQNSNGILLLNSVFQKVRPPIL